MESVDLRYDGQIIVNPDLEGIPRPATLTPADAKAAMSAGVKPAAIVNYEKYVTHPVPYGPKKADKQPVKVATKLANHRTAWRPKRKPAVARKNSTHSAKFVVIPAAAKKQIADSSKAPQPAPRSSLPSLRATKPLATPPPS